MPNRMHACNRYENLFYRISTPTGMIDIGWQMISKKHSSNIVCLLCQKEKRLYCAKTITQFTKHILKEHPAPAHFLCMQNWKKMII